MAAIPVPMVSVCLWMLFLAISQPLQGGVEDPGPPFKNLPFGQNHVTGSWKVAAETFFHPMKASRKKLLKGEGILVYLPKGKSPRDSRKELPLPEAGDLEVSLDFMLSPKAALTLELGNAYTITLTDSRGNPGPQAVTSGTVTTAFSGYEPYSNVGKPPGLWQNVRWVMRRSESGASRLEAVYLNEICIHQELEIPAKGASKGQPVVTVTGGSQPFSLRNFRYRKPESYREPDRGKSKTVYGEIALPVSQEPVLLRSFILYGDIKKTHILSTGYTEQVNMAYNLAKGAPLLMWRGRFLKANNMWDQRGLSQVAEPLGNPLELPDAPSLARLTSEEMVWPDSVTADADYHYKGYALEETGKPEFLYRLGAAEIAETFYPRQAGVALERTFTTGMKIPDLWCRAATGTVRKVAKGLYSINDYQYLIHTEGAVRIRTIDGRDELLLPFTETSLSYTIIY